jgi:DNA-binding CsgD family transcriptional regulator
LSASKHIDWSVQPLGQLPDKQVAERLGCSTQNVQQQRVKRGLPRAVPGTGVDWDAQPLGQIHDTELARRLGVALTAVRGARYRRRMPAFKTARRLYAEKVATRERLELLHGRYELSSFAIAEVLGIDQKTVYRALRRFGIARSHLEAMASPRTRQRIREGIQRSKVEREAAE